MKVIRFVTLAALLATMLTNGSAKVTIEKVLPFATEREVRVQVLVKSDQPAPIDLEGVIAAAADSSAELWKGSLGQASAENTSATIEKVIADLHPKLWTPGSPTLYNLTVTAKQSGASISAPPVRFGFRSVATKDGQILLNGKPIFLCGIAINPPGRDIRDEVGYSKKFATDYVRFLRSRHVNLIRMTFDFKAQPEQQAWFDACDELGMMVDQGNYGGPPGQGKKGPAIDPEEQQDAFAGKDPNAPRGNKAAPPEDFEKSVQTYKEVFETYARHPSIIIYVLSNELPGPVGSKPEWHDYLRKLDARINEWDPTRLVIGNAGYGVGGEGDLNDVHRYWGWYYNSFLTYFNLRDSVALLGASTDKQPLTFSECVGSFTSPFGGFNAIFRKQLAPQLGWTGHSGEQSKDALAYQAFMVKHALESFRTMREQNHRLAGLMPFTILFFNWEGITTFADMKPKPAMEQMGVSYAPVLTSIELWTSQVYADTRIKPIIHIVNDAEDFSDLIGAKLKLQLSGYGTQTDMRTKPYIEADYWKDEYPLSAIKYFEARSIPTTITLPDLPTGNYRLRATVIKNEKEISSNEENVYIAAKPKRVTLSASSIPVYDPAGKTITALNQIHIPASSVSTLAGYTSKSGPLVIGENATLTPADAAALKQFVTNGGRVLCFAQDAEKFDTSWLPAQIKMLQGSATDSTYTPKIRPTADQQNVNPERPSHPIFKNIPRERLRLWSDYTSWNQTKPGFPQVFPVTHGFKLTNEADLEHTAILADYDRGLEAVAIAEFFFGKGSVVFTGLDLINRTGLDPIADQLLQNLVGYLASPQHEVQPVIEKPIKWGDYPTERGVLTGPLQGLIYNCRWVAPPTSPGATPMPDNTGAWNTHPGNPFVPTGIRPFGPYTWSTGASPREDSKDTTGTGLFYCAVPPGRTKISTKVQNTQKESAHLAVSINGQAAQPTSVPPGETITITTPLPPATTNLSVRYTGEKQLVILETSFE